MVRGIAGTMAGCVAAIAVIMVAEMLCAQLYTLPVHDGSREGLARAMQAMPLGAELMVLAGWWLGTAVGGWLANRIARASWAALVVGGVIAAAVVANGIMLPHPVWMQLTGVLGPLAIGGAMWRAGRKTAAA